MRERAVQYQRRRRLSVYYVALPGLALCVISFVGVAMDFYRWPAMAIFCAGFVLVGVGNLAIRCPVCGKDPTGDAAIDKNPQNCAECGAILKWQD